MSCLSFEIHAHPAPTLKATPLTPPSLAVTPETPAALTLTPKPQGTLAVTPKPQGTVAVTPKPQGTVSFSEVCAVSSGELTVLAGPDGPLRFSNGGYWLLDPARES